MNNNSTFEYLIDPDINCFFLRHYGVFDLDIIIKGNKALEADKNFRWDLNRLVDVTNCELKLTSDDIRLLSDHISSRTQTGSCYKGGYIVDSSLAHGIARIFESFVHSPSNSYQIFHSDKETVQEDLREWLSLEKSYQFPQFMSMK